MPPSIHLYLQGQVYSERQMQLSFWQEEPTPIYRIEYRTNLLRSHLALLPAARHTSPTPVSSVARDDVFWGCRVH